ncbi:MAG: hypothetical protein JETCAE02_25420 [Anaerolineaceae bacterium]|nr:hypothetical protein [Anaerolineae bacterium]MBL1172275.1 hypothetical protein [Chloroflexota bacterium]MCL4825099.1 hypothetical protein [Anaerolineales bacterium]MDL1926165.1 hypothetical protein [Anaerolineae bacterium AMX1]GJQ40130.1 MAG: hypothetical protein JETCAE02_25420 [Anaerolineaceae bacterium]
MADSSQIGRLNELLSHVQEGYLTVEEVFPEKRSYKSLAVFCNDNGTMFMLIGEHKNAYAIFEASQFDGWSFHSGHSSLEGALNEIRDFRLKRIS